MKRKNFLLSLPLIGLAVKALSQPEETKPDHAKINVYDPVEQKWLESHPMNEKNRVVRVKKCEDGRFLIHYPESGETVKGDFIWTDDGPIKLV